MANANSRIEQPAAGGSFLLGPAGRTFTPEQWSEQQILVARTAEAFARDEIASAIETIEAKDLGALRALLQKAGKLGLTAVDVPEEYGGMGMDFTSSAIVADRLAIYGSFSVTFGAHAGIGTLPLVYFGTEEQKRRYLPRLAAAEWVGAYALSEASSGSDAMALKTEAIWNAKEDCWELNGEKMWISNAGIADLFTVFARAQGEVTAFLVEATFPGVETGAEEHKMGIQGSSTRPLLLRNARVPAGNVLGQVGDGGRIALQTLNVGRFKLGAACLGGARHTLRAAVEYARQRHAFGKPIAEFGLVQQMIADMALALYASEAMVYRTAGLLDAMAESVAARGTQALEEYAVECPMVKIEASEMLDGVVDRAVQIHGGNGYVRGNAVERAYRDSRVNRIFEGTNEINRLLTTGMLLKRAQKGRLALVAAVQEVIAERMRGTKEEDPAEQARKATLLALGSAYLRFGDAIAQEEEVLSALAELLVLTYRIQSVTARGAHAGATAILTAEAMDRFEPRARQVLAMVCEGDDLRTRLAWLKRLLRRETRNTIPSRREIARQAIESGGSIFGQGRTLNRG